MMSYRPSTFVIRSVNVGLPRELRQGDRVVTTGIVKEPVSGSVAVGRLGLDGDGQADRKAHGGEHKAVYAYSSNAYSEWRGDLERAGLSWGAFGENLTVDGLDEAWVHVGDLFEAGSCRLRVAQPRIPCFKLGMRFGDDSIVERFLHARRPGVYFAVEREGALAAGDALRLIEEGEGSIPLLELFVLFRNRGTDADRARELLGSRHLIPSWAEKLRNFLARTSSEPPPVPASSALVIRPADHSDDPGLRAISSDWHEDLRQTYEPAPDKDGAARIVPFARLVAVADGEVAGTVSYEIEGDALHFGSLGVLRRHRRKGIARALVTRLREISRRLGLDKVSCETIEETGNLPFFLGLGFSVVSRQETARFRADARGAGPVRLLLVG